MDCTRAVEQPTILCVYACAANGVLDKNGDDIPDASSFLNLQVLIIIKLKYSSVVKDYNITKKYQSHFKFLGSLIYGLQFMKSTIT